MLRSKFRWNRLYRDESNEEAVRALIDSLNITYLTARLLVNRGIQNVEEAKEFLHIKEPSFHDPFLLDGMERACERIFAAIRAGEKIVVYGDYDADGVSSTAVLLTALKELGANVDFYIPNRFSEGYGPNEHAFRMIHEKGCRLIITVDTGIAAINEADLAKRLGIDLIITDHHEPGPVLPDAYAIIHPKLPNSTYPFKELAGVGVAFKMVHALYGKVPESLIEIAAIGTIADLVPLYGENRLLAKKGIEKLKTTTRPGINSLLSIAGVDKSSVNEETIGFVLGPRINAAGRLQEADPAVELLLTDDKEKADMLAKEIDQLNKQRQKLVQEITDEAIKEIEKNFPIEDNPVLVVAKENWNSGVIGIVASRLVEKFYRPAIVLSIDRETGLAKGSARSIQGFDLFKNLSECRELLPHFGGHTMAAGMTLKAEHIDELRQKMIDLANSQLSDEDFIPVKNIECACSLEHVTIKAVEELEKLAPFGVDNPKPLFLLENVNAADVRKIGVNGNHLKMKIEEKEFELDVVGFGQGELAEEISPFANVSIVGELAINEWNYVKKPQLLLQDLAVPAWQLFDWRGSRGTEALLSKLPAEKRLLIAFHEESIKLYKDQPYIHEIHIISEIKDYKNIDVSNKYVVFLDMPPAIEFLVSAFEQGMPERIYAIFYQHADHFFQTMPTREHFKWYYAFLTKKSSFDYKKYGEDLAKYRGWTKETIFFMTKVFFELEFVTINNGVITLNKKVKKRDLSESGTYQQKLDQMKLEQQLLYSSYQELKEWFEKAVLKRDADKFLQVHEW
ncbi:single-stranded-DNA-specific exonuclease RecJ [Aeribacillus sp. FSL W8-0870]|uniref:single-stranded-DNA-specific exonuclease RecJ n=1 Tax=Aeribacillus sp. FSL W8-0870 TaxID=2954706 RepID=UPI0030CD1D51